MADRQTHWETIYRRQGPTAVSWHRAHLETSLRLIERAGLGPEARIIDVGGGASTLVDDLLARGFRHVTVLDISDVALEAARARLGARAEAVTWQRADILQLPLLAQAYDLWHDRAVFHFLTRAEERQRYLAALRQALRSGGWVILAAFAPDGPPRCSGLDVARYSPETLQAELGRGFALIESVREEHLTPRGAPQPFAYSLFQLA